VKPVIETEIPTVSVVLPVYNCPEYVGVAIESVLAQTYESFELIVIDDGSTDDTPDVLRRYRDPRIRLFTQTNQGLARTLNRGISEARGKYVGRQDQDDLSRPARLAKQVAFLDGNPRCALIGTWAEIWVDNAPTERFHRHPSQNAVLKSELLFDNPFVHSSVMIRKSALAEVGHYSTDPGRQPPEDYELWSRLARRFDVANIPEVLHVYREVSGSMSRSGPSPFMDHLVTISSENIAWAAGLEPSNPQVINIAALVHRAYEHVRLDPDFSEMRSILRQASMAVAPDLPQGGHAVDRRITRLRTEWRAYRHAGRNWTTRIARRLADAASLTRRQ
jgi:hypothetical protein